MQLLFWFSVIVLLSIVIYQFLPAVQIYVNDKIHSLRKMSQFVEDYEYEIPYSMVKQNNDGTGLENINMTGYRTWGNPIFDGPDRCLPDHCWWKSGILYCKNHPT
jgi:hypothetical protein